MKCAPPGWSDSDGEDCAYYRDKKYCNPDGSYGSAWWPQNDSNFEPFSNFKNEYGGKIYNALHCEECGCGRSSTQDSKFNIRSRNMHIYS